MARKRWTVVVEWENDTCADSDELVVYAKTAAGAASRARARWTNLASQEKIWIERVFVLTPARRREFA